MEPISTRLSRRGLLGLAGAAGVAGVAACAGPGGSTSPSAPAGPATGAVEGEVSFAHWRAEDSAAFDELIAGFVAATPGVTVTQDITPSNDFQSQALNRVRGGTIGDVVPTFRGAQFNQFVDAGVYTDLTDSEVTARFEPSLITPGQRDGKQWGLPYQVVFPVPVANTQALEEAGVSEVPTDWEGFLELCETLLGADLIPLAWPGGEAGNAGQLFNSMVMNNQPAEDSCAQIEAGTAKVTDEWFLTTLAQYAELRPYFQPNATGSAVEPTQQLFASGEAAMLATGSYHLAAVRALGATFDVALAPPITTTAEGATYEGVFNSTFILGVNTRSQVQPAASAWLSFLSDPANAAAYADATVQHLSVRDVAYTNPDLQALAPWLTRTTLLAPRFQFLDLDIRNAVEGACTAVVGGTSPEEAAERAQQVVDERI